MRRMVDLNDSMTYFLVGDSSNVWFIFILRLNAKCLMNMCQDVWFSTNYYLQVLKIESV